MTYSRIVGTGCYLPEKILSNFDLEKMVDTSNEWIITRSGIRQRHIAADQEMASDLALHASKKAIAAAAIDPDSIGLIIVATTTPDMIFPSTACILQEKLHIRNCPAFDIQAVCSGFVYALSIADLFIQAGKCDYALIVGTDIYSRIVDWTDRTTCVLFGDGAGAVVVKRSESAGILATRLHADGNYQHLLSVPASVCKGVVSGNAHVQMDGSAVFKFAVKVLDEIVEETLAAANLKKSDIDWLIPHQANIRIIQSTAKKLGLPMDKVVVTLDKHGNTSAASIPLALDTAVRDGRIKEGQLIMLEAVGGGFTWGAALIRW
jgi:3-oxoacyl-[acyl-carrier-protein] synthase III